MQENEAQRVLLALKKEGFTLEWETAKVFEDLGLVP